MNMAGEFQLNGNWWNNSSSSNLEISTAASFDDDWPNNILHIKQTLPVMDLTLSSPGLSWNQTQTQLDINEGFSTDQQRYTCDISSNGSNEASEGLITNFDSGSINYSYPSTYYNYMNTAELVPNRSKFPELKIASPPKQHPPLHAAPLSLMNNVRSSFCPSLPGQFSTPIFEEKQKSSIEVGNVCRRMKKTNSVSSVKRPRNETPSPLPASKVRKEKMGDRITALQQLVSPFGKTDTASVLSEVIEYIKFLHGQVTALSSPYMKIGASSTQHHQKFDKFKDEEGSRKDLRSRGLCFVPVSSTFPIIHESTLDSWTPLFGEGTLR